MTDYTNLQEKLLEAAIYHTTGAHGEKMFKEAAEAIRQLVAEREGVRSALNDWLEKTEWVQDEAKPKDLGKHRAEAIKALVAERDAAFAMSKCECESNEACANLVKLRDEVERLKSALRKAEKALVMNIVGTSGRTPATHEAITTIRTALGETE